MMKVIESWEDNHAKSYAIVRYSKEDQRAYRTKKYEAMYMSDLELYSFGGTVGHGVADFNTIGETREFMLKGITLQEINPDIWLEMVAA